MYPIFFIGYHFLLVLIPLVHLCDGEVVYVTPTPPPNFDCPDGLPCQTLQHYFSNSSFTEQNIDLTMIFLIGQHEGVCEQTELKSHSFNATGVGVTIKCTYIEFRKAVAMFFTNVTLNHCYVSSQCLSVLIVEMSSAVMQNKTRMHITHASNVSGNKIKLVNTIFRSSSISGIFSFINNKGAMFLANSTLNIGQNTRITFVKCQIHPGIYLNYSTLNVEGNVDIAFINNSRSSLMMKFSSLNIMRMINISFIRNSNTSEEGIAVNVEHSTMTTEDNCFFY